jgi:hypothetical protein
MFKAYPFPGTLIRRYLYSFEVCLNRAQNGAVIVNQGAHMSGSQPFTTLSILLIACFASTGLASEKVTISTGEVVILNDDGTWNYENRPVQRNKVIKTDRSGFRETDNCDYSYGSNIDG